MENLERTVARLRADQHRLLLQAEEMKAVIIEKSDQITALTDENTSLKETVDTLQASIIDLQKNGPAT